MEALISIVFVITVFLFIIAVYESFGSKDRINKRLRHVSGEGEAEEKKSEKGKQNFIKKLQQRKSDRRQKFNREKARRERNNQKESATEIMLETADIDMTAEQFSTLKIVVCITGIVLSFLISRLLRMNAAVTMLLIAVVGLLCLIAPTRVLKSKIQKRKKKIWEQLPDIIDLLVVSVEAGLGFDAALIRLYEKNKSELMVELMQATRDINRGMSKKDAYNNLSKRCGVKELTSFLTSMVQADQMGISVKSVLKVQSVTLREKRRQKAEEKALKAPVLMLVPMVVFIFPVIFIILLGPAIINIMEVL